MGAAMIIHRRYENLENEDGMGRSSAAGSIIVVPDDEQAQGSDRRRSRSPLKDVAKEKVTK